MDLSLALACRCWDYDGVMGACQSCRPGANIALGENLGLGPPLAICDRMPMYSVLIVFCSTTGIHWHMRLRLAIGRSEKSGL